MASGASATGLALAGKLLGAAWRVHAVSVKDPEPVVAGSALRVAKQVAERLELPAALDRSDFYVHDQYVGPGHGKPAPETLEAIKLLARTDALFVDPVYTGKALSGAIGEIRAGRISPTDVVVLVHTGGLPIIFAYHEALKNL